MVVLTSPCPYTSIYSSMPFFLFHEKLQNKNSHIWIGLVLICANLNGEGNVLELVETLARVEKKVT
jgi:hypothetical protein